jgi:hypothetical protein
MCHSVVFLFARVSGAWHICHPWGAASHLAYRQTVRPDVSPGIVRPMSCKFTIDVDDDPAVLIAKARTALASIGGKLEGDAVAGTVSGDTAFGSIEGTYSVVGRAVSFVITKKPVLVPCAMIESQLRQLV